MPKCDFWQWEKLELIALFEKLENAKYSAWYGMKNAPNKRAPECHRQ
jgi:hypothetical protein